MILLKYFVLLISVRPSEKNPNFLPSDYENYTIIHCKNVIRRSQIDPTPFPASNSYASNHGP